MLNFRPYYHFCYTFCFFTQIFLFHSRIEANTSHQSDVEFNMIVDTLKNCNNLDDKIDCFIDAGMLYQKATSKNFNYKDFLKQTYLHLKNEGIYVDEKTKKDLEKLIENRITERFFKHNNTVL